MLVAPPSNSSGKWNGILDFKYYICSGKKNSPSLGLENYSNLIKYPSLCLTKPQFGANFEVKIPRKGTEEVSESVYWSFPLLYINTWGSTRCCQTIQLYYYMANKAKENNKLLLICRSLETAIDSDTAFVG